MARTLGELMSPNPVMLESSSTAAEAARAMKDNSIGDVLVIEDGALFGIVTDRDIVTRCIAEGADPASTPVGQICTTDPVSLSATDGPDRAVHAMRENALRRVAIMDDGRPVGVVSLGDLAVALDRESALGEISAAPPNN